MTFCLAFQKDQLKEGGFRQGIVFRYTKLEEVFVSKGKC
jgi:hypothetical protein